VGGGGREGQGPGGGQGGGQTGDEGAPARAGGGERDRALDHGAGGRLEADLGAELGTLGEERGGGSRGALGEERGGGRAGCPEGLLGLGGVGLGQASTPPPGSEGTEHPEEATGQPVTPLAEEGEGSEGNGGRQALAGQVLAEGRPSPDHSGPGVLLGGAEALGDLPIGEIGDGPEEEGLALGGRQGPEATLEGQGGRGVHLDRCGDLGVEGAGPLGQLGLAALSGRLVGADVGEDAGQPGSQGGVVGQLDPVEAAVGAEEGLLDGVVNVDHVGEPPAGLATQGVVVAVDELDEGLLVAVAAGSDQDPVPDLTSHGPGLRRARGDRHRTSRPSRPGTTRRRSPTRPGSTPCLVDGPSLAEGTPLETVLGTRPSALERVRADRGRKWDARPAAPWGILDRAGVPP
jgi:hypothetical protein